MKHLVLWSVAVLMAWPALAGTNDKSLTAKTGNTIFLAYEGKQSWPTGEVAQSEQDYAVPVYWGLPAKPYKVLGRVVDERQEGLDLVEHTVEDVVGQQKDRLRNCANQGKRRGGDAVVVTDDERVLKTLNLTEKDARRETPLAHERKDVVLVIKF